MSYFPQRCRTEMVLKVTFTVLLHCMSGDLSLGSNPEVMRFIPPEVLKPRELVQMPLLASGEDCVFICFAFETDDPATGAILSVLLEVSDRPLTVFVFRFFGLSLYLGVKSLPQYLPGLASDLFNEQVAKLNDVGIYSIVFCGILVHSPGTPLRNPSNKRRRQGRTSDLEDSATVDLAEDTSSICRSVSSWFQVAICRVCMNGAADHALVPCGHVLCGKDAQVRPGGVPM